MTTSTPGDHDAPPRPGPDITTWRECVRHVPAWGRHGGPAMGPGSVSPVPGSHNPTGARLASRGAPGSWGLGRVRSSCTVASASPWRLHTTSSAPGRGSITARAAIASLSP